MKICINHVFNTVIVQAYDENGYWRQEFLAWGGAKPKIKANTWLLNLPPESQKQIATVVENIKSFGPTFNESGALSLSSKARQLPGYRQTVIHPVRKTETTLGNTIIDLNDNYKWPREQIADWIETLDPVPTFEVE